MNQFNPLDESLDMAWLQANGWTPSGNLAYRHILHDFLRDSDISQERICQIIMQYGAENQVQKIIQTLQETIDLQKDVQQLFKNGEQK